jgi:uncharacterized protein YndB with AHSA1/START domain
MSEVRVQQALDAPPERVWRAWTESREWADWMWPARFESRAEVDAQPGGRYRLASAVAGMAVSGAFTRVEEPARLEFSWCWDGEEALTTVALELTADGDGTLLTLTHDGFATEDARSEHQQGWRDCLGRLPAHLAAR